MSVVVPIYDHWTSLARCIAALREHLDPELHRVILVNDVGPHADTIEQLVLDAIDGASNFSYYRNPSNLGFVRTCNRAVFELDTSGNDVLLLNSDAEITAGAVQELLAVLAASEHHGAVCPRSNNATIANLPFWRRAGAPEELSPDAAQAIASQVAPLLPRYSLAPVAVGFCLLIRRSLIDNHGLFDEAYGRGYNEENDFCMRINALGYSAVIANHAFVLHEGSTSFADAKNELDARNHELLMSRYPHYLDAVDNFLRFGYTAADQFAEVLAAQPGVPQSVLIDLHHLSLVYNGSTRYALSFLRSLSERELGGIEVTVQAQQGAIDFFDLPAYGFRVVPYGSSQEEFDLGLALAPVNDVRQLTQLNARCARWVVSHFDMIASRSYALMLTDRLRPLVVELALRRADHVVALSEFSVRDAISFYPALAERLTQTAEGVLLGSTRDAVVGETAKHLLEVSLEPAVAALLERGGYVLVMGNFYPHKQVAPALEALTGAGLPIVAFGPLAGIPDSDDLVVIASGTLSESQLEGVFGNAALVVFPSAYEGFGLPIADSLDYGVPVIAFDTEVAREVVTGLGGEKAVRFFQHFDQLAGMVADALADARLQKSAAALRHKVRSLEPFNDRLWQVAVEELGTPLDLAALDARYDEVKRLERLVAAHLHDSGRLTGELESLRLQARDILNSRTYRTGARIARAASPVLRLIRRR